jgi:transposase-like protein
MRTSRFSEAQIIGVLQEQEAGSTTAEVCRRHGISEQTFYRWKAKSGASAGPAGVGRAAAGRDLLSKVACRKALVMVGWHRCIRDSEISHG